MLTRVASLAVALLLALPMTALAVEGTSTESLTVTGTLITMTGVPATIDYGSGPAGSTVVAEPFTIYTFSSSDTGATFSTNGLGFDVGNGYETFGAEARSYHVDELQDEGEFVFYDADDTTFEDIDVGTGLNLGTTWTVTLAVDIPAGTYPTDVTSAVTFRYEVNP